MDLYNWWTKIYPNRPDAMEVSGWSAICEEQRKLEGGLFGSLANKDPVMRKRMNKAHKIMNRIDRDYEKEDEQMMIRLIRIRNSLWT